VINKMVYDNSSYTVTAPDLYLTDDGISVLICSQDELFRKKIKDLLERYIISSLVFFENKNVTTEQNVAWEYFVSKQADLMIVDMDTCEYVDLCVALTRPIPQGKWTLFVNRKGSKREVLRIISAEGKYYQFRTIDEIEQFIITELQGPL
tara:strand:- start:1992 stop:2441 length:450 start_codon:yes stop_codon:yes gene_type:complete